MAFDHEDTDALYKSTLLPAIRETPATPVRIDRIEHNDDINNKIIEELRDCDFAIADLTYARPSVYFEAGYAQSRVPVIYTCRNDHFRPRPNDEHGNLRVHFDLQMKNIISWKQAGDPQFKERLQKRIGVTVRPLLRARRKNELDSEAIRSFSALSDAAKLGRAQEISVSSLKRTGFKHLDLIVPRTAFWAGMRGHGKKLQIASLYAPRTGGWRDIRSQIEWKPILFSLLPDLPFQDSTVEDHSFVLAIPAIPRTRASKAFFNFAYDEENGTFWRQGNQSVGLKKEVLVKEYVHMVSGITSEIQLREELKRRVLLLNSSL